MDGDGPDRVIDADSLDEKRAVHDNDTRDEPDDRRTGWRDKRARGRDGHQAGQHAIAHHRRVGFAHLELHHNHRRDGPYDRGEDRVHYDKADA
jgi:hypothetical protein